MPERFRLVRPVPDRVIHVHAGQLLMLWSVALRGGVCRNGAGIFNRHWTTIARVGLRWNTAAVDTQDDNGGGLLNEGTAFIDDTRVTDNTGAVGGGIMNLGTLRLVTTEIGWNHARFWGAGLTNRGGSMEVVRSTIHGNVDGGIIDESGSLRAVGNVSSRR
jgi:hypothetical protein